MKKLLSLLFVVLLGGCGPDLQSRPLAEAPARAKATERAEEPRRMANPPHEGTAQESAREEARTMINQILEISRHQRATEDQLSEDNAVLHMELENEQKSHAAAEEHATAVQRQVNAVTDDRNAQAKLKDAAIEKADYWHTKQAEAVKKLWFWRFLGTAGIIFNVALAAVGLAIRFTKWGAENLGPIVKRVVA